MAGRAFTLPTSFYHGESTVFGKTDFQVGLTANFEYITTFMNAYVPRIDSDAWEFDFPLEAVDGTSAAPSYSFKSDTKLGIYRIASNKLGATANDKSGEIYPKPYILAASDRSTDDITNIDAVGQLGREATVALEHNSQLCLVQVTIDTVWKNVPQGEQIFIQPYINQVRIAGFAVSQTGTSDTDATAGGTGDTGTDATSGGTGDTGTDATSSGSGSDVTGVSGSVPGHSHLSGTYQLSGNHSHSHNHSGPSHSHSHNHSGPSHDHSHTHTGGLARVPLSITAHYEAAADASGNLDIGFWADTETGTADIDENTISYTVWRR